MQSLLYTRLHAYALCLVRAYVFASVCLHSHAGSLTNLAKYPASTVQILGAEKALFRYVCKAHAYLDATYHLQMRAQAILLTKLSYYELVCQLFSMAPVVPCVAANMCVCMRGS